MSIVSRPQPMRRASLLLMQGLGAALFSLPLLWPLMGSRFIANTAGMQVSGAVALVAGMLVGLRSWLKPPVSETAPADKATNDRLLTAAGAGLAASCLAFLLTSQGLLEAWTLYMGQPGQVTMRLGSYAHSRHRCDGFDLLGAPPQTRRLICLPASEAEARAWAPGTPVVLTGMTSPLGIAVDRYLIDGAGS